MNNNGFADALDKLNTLIQIDRKVELAVLEEAADYFVQQLKPLIPVGQGSSHLKDELKVVVKNDIVQVQFSNKAWYWHLAEHGHKKANGKGRVKGRHFVRNTIDRHGEKIAEMMATKIIKKMEG